MQSPLENKHTKLPEKWEEILKAIDSNKPRLEITNPQEGFIWETGASVTLEGKVYDEYLPADCSLKIELYKAGDNFNPIFSEERKPDPITGWTPLKSSDLWRADDPNSPVAEFREEVSLPSGTNPEWTYTIRLTVTNPAGLSSDIKQVTEKTFYLYGVAKDGSGVSKLWCIDGPTSFVDSVAAIVQEIKLVDEVNNPIESKVLDVTSGSGYIWVSFDDKKIRKYNVYGEAERVDSTRWYWTVSNIPDGLYYDGSGLQYCSSGANKLYKVSSSEADTDLGTVSRRLSLDGMATDNLSVNYTTQEYGNYNLTAISGNYFCSSNKVTKRDRGIGQNFIQTLPSGTPIWANEQDAPAPVVGIVEVIDYSIPEGYVVYISCTDGNIYKVRFINKQTNYFVPSVRGATKRVSDAGLIEYLDGGDEAGRYRGNIITRQSAFFPTYNLFWDWLTAANPITGVQYPERWVLSETYRIYGRVTLPSPFEFKEAFVIYKDGISKSQTEWNGSVWIEVPGPYLLETLTYKICSFDDSWNAEQKFNNPILSTTLWTQVDGGQGGSGAINVIDVTDVTPITTFYYTGRYEDESQTFPVGPFTGTSPSPIPVGYIFEVYRTWQSRGIGWAFLTDRGSLEIICQFAAPSVIWDGVGTGNRINMRIKTGYPISVNVGDIIQLEAHGKEPLKWITSDENIGKVDSNGLFTAMSKGTCTVTVQDALGNTAVSEDISVR